MLYSYILVCVRVTFDSCQLKISDKVTYMHHNTPDCTAFRLHELSKFIYKGVFCHRGVLGSYQLAFVLRLSVTSQVQHLGSRKLFRIYPRAGCYAKYFRYQQSRSMTKICHPICFCPG